MTVKALLVPADSLEPGQVIEVEPDQIPDHIGGWLEPIHFAEHGHCYVDEEGKLKRRTYNARATALACYLGWLPGIVRRESLVGPALFLASTPSGDEADVPADVLRIARTTGILLD